MYLVNACMYVVWLYVVCEGMSVCCRGLKGGRGEER